MDALQIAADRKIITEYVAASEWVEEPPSVKVDCDFAVAARARWPAALTALEDSQKEVVRLRERIAELESAYLEADKHVKSWD